MGRIEMISPSAMGFPPYHASWSAKISCRPHSDRRDACGRSSSLIFNESSRLFDDLNLEWFRHDNPLSLQIPPLLALFGHPTWTDECPLSGVKRTWRGLVSMSAYDPKQTRLDLRSGARHAPPRAATGSEAPTATDIGEPIAVLRGGNASPTPEDRASFGSPDGAGSILDTRAATPNEPSCIDSRLETCAQRSPHSRRPATRLYPIMLFMPFGPRAAHVVQLRSIRVEQGFCQRMPQLPRCFGVRV
jgi:hypothetical protein